MTSNQSASTNQKIVVALFQLISIVSAFFCEKLLLADQTIYLGSVCFVFAIFRGFNDEYLRIPTAGELRAIYEKGDKLEFPGALGPLVCAGWSL